MARARVISSEGARFERSYDGSYKVGEAHGTHPECTGQHLFEVLDLSLDR
jgi:hypothetical protein